MTEDLMSNVIGGVLLAAFAFGIWLAIIMGIRAIIRKLRKAGPSNGIPGWAWLLATIFAMAGANQEQLQSGDGMYAVATSVLFLAAVVIAVTLLVRVIIGAARRRDQQDPEG